MKKLLGIVFLGLVAIGFTACSVKPETQSLSSEQSLSSMAYLSANFLSLSGEQTSQGLAVTLGDDALEVEEELETVNDYLELLKVFMENGATDFAQIVEQASDRVEYQFMINITVAEEVYVLYYNVDVETSEITGIFIINDEEYTIMAYNNLEDKDEFEDDEDDDLYEDEDDEDDEDDDLYEDEESDDDEEELDDVSFTNLSEVTTETTTEEATTEDSITEEETTEVDGTSGVTLDAPEAETATEEKMVLVASNGENFIKMTYKTETEEDEASTKFELESYINGVEKEISIKIKNENNEYKVEVEDGENSFEFKKEIENDGIKYQLEYEVNGTEGEIQIFETIDEFGETVYIYEIEEEGKYKEVEIEDQDEDDDEEDDLEDTGFLM